MSDWIVRIAGPHEHDSVRALWLASYWPSRYGRRYHDERNGGRARYREELGGRIDRILRHATVRVACDPSDEDVWYGLSVVEPNVVHYALAKRSWHREHLGWDLFRALLADELKQECVLTHELVEFARHDAREDGAKVPSQWLYDEGAWSRSHLAWLESQRKAA